MIGSLQDRKMGHLPETILKYTVLTILSPVFFLLALMHVILHPNQSAGVVQQDPVSKLDKHWSKPY
jgi:hypothetical protein